MIRGARAVKASCEQLLIDLVSLQGKLPEEDIQKKQEEFIHRIEHEANLLKLLEGKALAERWRGYVECGYSKLSLKLRLLGLVLVLPHWLCDGILRLMRG